MMDQQTENTKVPYDSGLEKNKTHKGVIVNNSTAPAQRGKAHDFILMKRNLT